GLGTSTNWTGAGLAIRKNDWTLDRAIITNHTGDVLTYTNLGSTQTPASSGFGYFFMNDLKTLTTYGEWYHNPVNGKFYMYFGTVDPTTKIVQVALLSNLINNSTGYDYINIDNLNLKGAINNAINFLGTTDYLTVQNSDISFCGKNGIELEQGIGFIVDNNTINQCNSYGIYSYYASKFTITNNTISNIAVIPGQSTNPQGNGAMFFSSNDGSISYNSIKNTGYNGIYVRPGGTLDKTINISCNNIDSVCLVLNDGGGIYTAGTWTTGTRKIDRNIITNAIGNGAGAVRQTSLAMGIYLDEYASNCIVTNNSVANTGYSGIKVHKAHNDTVTDNTTYNCLNGISFQNSSVAADFIHDILLRRNIFFAKTSLQIPLSFVTNEQDDITKFGIADSNFYTRPMDENKTFTISQPSPGWRQVDLAAWQAFSLQDVHSKKSPITVINQNDMRFETNPTKVDKTISLDGKYITVDSKIYDGSVTLKPFSSVVLMKYTGTGVESINNDKNQVKFYPNPISNQFSIEINGDNESHGFEILNSTGQVVLNGKIAIKTVVDSSTLSQGIYFVKIGQGNNFVTNKFIKI
ncbi:MAG: right-handed parallel beta-helix repeat-containing protein, partial [Paludibacter sp.]